MRKGVISVLHVAICDDEENEIEYLKYAVEDWAKKEDIITNIETYAQMNEAEKREFLSQLVDNVQIYEERKENGQWLKSIEFKLPIIEKEFTLSLDNDTQNETVVLLSKGEVDSKKIRVEFSLEDMDMSEFQNGATYPQIKEYVLEHTGLKVSNLYISQIKRKCGIGVGKNYNLPKSEDSRQPQCPPEKEKAIREAFKYFGMI